MTHMTPTILLFGCCCTILSFVYFLFHSWSFDRFQSLVPTKRRAFKVGITWSLIIANIGFTMWLAGLGYMKYHMGYQTVPGLGDIPTPYALWPPAYKSATVPLYYVLAWAFISHMALQTEETCFWAHLVASIRGITTATWFASIWFKIWVVFTLLGAGSILGVVIPWDSDPQTMELHIFLAATVYTALFTLTSIYVIVSFPLLIKSVRDQGGSQIVINRLHYHRTLTKYRMVARMIFIVCFMVMSVDGFTPHQDIAHDAFGTDLLLMLGILGLVGSTIISVYMFFPPDQPRPSPETPSLLPDTPESRPPSFDTTASLHLRSGNPGSLLSGSGLGLDNKPPVSISIGINPPSNHSLGANVVNALRHAASRDRLRKLERERERDEAYQRELDRRAERAQQHSLRSIVAPFATPPGSPAARPDNSPALGTGRRSSPERRPREHSTSRSASDATDSEKGAAAMERGNQYAWSLLADHLRLPETAMGLVGEATEMNRRGWRAAQRAAQDAMIPPNLRPQEPREVLESPKSATHKPPFPYPFVTPPPPLGGAGSSSSSNINNNSASSSAPALHSSPLGPSPIIGKKEKRNSALPLPLSTFRSLPPPMRKSGSRGRDGPLGPQSPNENDLDRSVGEAADRPSYP